MSSLIPAFQQVTIAHDVLLHALKYDAKGAIYDWRMSYPVLAALDKIQMTRSATIFPSDCPNTACDAYIFSQLGMLADSGSAIAQAVSHSIPVAEDDLAHHRKNPWFCLTPVHWRAGRDQVRLIDFDKKEITVSEVKQLIDSIAPWLAELGWHIHVIATNNWLVRSNQPFDYNAPSLSLAKTDQLEHFLPIGTDLKRWQTLLTEIQMAWFEHPVNQARATTGRLSINSLWLHNGSHATQWSGASIKKWTALKKNIHTFSATQVHQHLSELNFALTPTLNEVYDNKKANVVFLGDTWQQDLALQKPKFVTRLKKRLRSKNNAPLKWLETPQFDLSKRP